MSSDCQHGSVTLQCAASCSPFVGIKLYVKYEYHNSSGVMFGLEMFGTERAFHRYMFCMSIIYILHFVFSLLLTTTGDVLIVYIHVN